MAADSAGAPARQPTRFLLLYALAWAGGAVAYVPLLTLLLPVKMAVAAGALRVEWLAAATLLGAIAASVANVAFGWASDLSGTRRGWAAGGLALTLASYAAIAWVATPAGIVAAIIAYQIALNMMLAALAAWAADTVPDSQKGLLGGLIGTAQPIGAAAGVVATLPLFPGETARLAVVAALIALLTLPLLLAGQARPIAQPPDRIARRVRGRDLALLWVSRLLIQIAGNVLFAFLFYYFQALPGGASELVVAELTGATMIVAIPAALAAGRASDRLGARRPFLAGAALTIAAGLAIMSAMPTFGFAILGYAFFGCGLAVFLALHSVYAMQLLPSPRNYGRDLGVFNLTNTLPAIISPLLAIGLVPAHGFGALMLLLAALATIAAALIVFVTADAQTS